MAALAPRIARGGPVYDRINTSEGDIRPSGASVPLRLAGGLHHLVRSGAAPRLAALYPPHQTDDAALVMAVEATLAQHGAFFDRWLDSPPQTNEVRRAAILIAAAHLLAAKHPLPLRLSELGASAGLNLCFDQFALTAEGTRLGPDASAVTLNPDWTGPLPAVAPLHVAERRGVDLRPVRYAREDGEARLMAYLWPDQPERLTNTAAAIDIARALRVTVDAGEAAEWLETRLNARAPGQLHMIYHTIAWQYFPTATTDRCRAAIEAAGANATADAPLAWLGMEADAIDDGAAVTLRLWPGDQHITLGRVDFHGRWVRWQVPALGT